MAKLKSCLRSNLLTILTVTGVVSGIILGIILRETSNEKWTPREILYLNFIGDLFLRILKSLILPLIVTSLISAIGSLDLSLSGRIGVKAIFYYITTTVIAVILGIILVTTIQPGVINDEVDGDGDNKDNNTINDNNNNKNDTINVSNGKPMTRNITTVDTLLDLVRNMFPPNLVQACFEQFQTVLTPPINNKNESDLQKWSITEDYAKGMNILGLVVASCTFGIALSAMKKDTQTILKLFQELSQLMMKITGWVIWLSPIGILFLISAKLQEMDNLNVIIGKLGVYFLTVAGGILFHGFIILPLIYLLVTKKNPYKFVCNMGKAMATAFGTSSSSATLPVTIQCLEDDNNIDTRVARFVLPIGATINMDGTALYEAVACIFIAQIRGLELTFGNILAISITATAASIGAAGIPQAGLVTLVMVLDTVGLPAEDVSLIVAVDWLLDRFRTVVNVLGDSFGAGIVAHLSRNDLKSIEEKPIEPQQQQQQQYQQQYPQQFSHQQPYNQQLNEFQATNLVNNGFQSDERL